ncbi:hypothetical protein VR46_29195 [Streptomyces sp. NRRL S-444]|nr:hypothetical protein VR46_29195 [Streptomyces sp. NRRL S-444]
MIDISESLRRLSRDPASWSEAAATTFATSLAHSCKAFVDWDADADEAWISILIQDGRAAMVSTKLPLVIALDKIPVDATDSTCGRTTISVPSFDAPVLYCDSSVLDVAFDGENGLRTLSTEGFSANDLWFATV